MKKTHHLFLLCVILLFACTKQAQPIPPTTTSAPPIEAPPETPTEVPSNTDPTLFGAITQTEIQAYSLEPVASAIFNKVMDAFIANGDILEYQVTRVTIFPAGDGSLYAEITYNVRTTDIIWLEDGGAQAEDNWINDKCNRFDFVTTEAEFQLKNRRTCN
jgi:hypothetical protein